MQGKDNDMRVLIPLILRLQTFLIFKVFRVISTLYLLSFQVFYFFRVFLFKVFF